MFTFHVQLRLMLRALKTSDVQTPLCLHLCFCITLLCQLQSPLNTCILQVCHDCHHGCHLCSLFSQTTLRCILPPSLYTYNPDKKWESKHWRIKKQHCYKHLAVVISHWLPFSSTLSVSLHLFHFGHFSSFFSLSLHLFFFWPPSSSSCFPLLSSLFFFSLHLYFFFPVSPYCFPPISSLSASPGTFWQPHSHIFSLFLSNERDVSWFAFPPKSKKSIDYPPPTL